VNDIAVLGAEPLFFLDYLATGKLEPHVFTDIIKGFRARVPENNCALIGRRDGADAGLLSEGEYDVSGTNSSAWWKIQDAERSEKPSGAATWSSASNRAGLHTNGYSLGRKIFFETVEIEAVQAASPARAHARRELLKVHVSYGPLCRSC